MSETTPDPADVHTGTDRGGCTCGEGDAVGDTTPGPCFVDASGFTVHRPPGLTDEEHHRRLWRDLADKDIQHGVDWPGVVRVLFADIDALTAEVEFSTGTDRVELTICIPGQCCQGYCVDDTLHDLTKDQADRVRDVVAARVQALTAERDRLRVDTNINADEVERQRGLLDLARAELASANARCAELEALVEGMHREVDRIGAENLRHLATLDRVTAEVAQMEHGSGGWMLRDWWDSYYRLRAALTPEGTE